MSTPKFTAPPRVFERLEAPEATDDGYQRLLELVGAASEPADALPMEEPDRAIDRLVYGD